MSNMYYVWSQKPPEDVRIFGLRSVDIEATWTTRRVEAPEFPDDSGFVSTNEHGICKYCQLLLVQHLSKRASPYSIVHQPSLQALILSNCRVCSWVEASITGGCPELVELHRQGDPALHDPDDTTYHVTLAISRNPEYTQAVAELGVRRYPAAIGTPLIITTLAQLGTLRTRVFWQPYELWEARQPHSRLEILKTWFNECFDHHERCLTSRNIHDHGALPKRVLDLTGSPATPSVPDDVRIRLRVTSPEDKGRYIALSYCWGSEKKFHFTTTSQNLDERIDKINFGSLPLTQKEAVLVALYLGIRYLWIDSLCIVQDHQGDWEAEAANMSRVYSNAVLTLAATASQNPGHGLLHPLQSARCVPLDGDTAMIRLQTHTDIDSSAEPLNTRGWTLQEDVLSRRIVSFGREQWLWRCASRYATEDGLEDRDVLASESLHGASAQIVECSVEERRKLFLKQWYGLVCNYSRRKLTFRKDKLSAIAGLVDIYTERTGFRYVHGLWMEDIGEGLMWQATSLGVTRDLGTIPTWSWASVDGAILMQGFSESDISMIELLKLDQGCEGTSAGSHQVPHRLHVRGARIMATVGKRSVTQKLRYRLSKGDDILGEAFLDDTSPAKHENFEVSCLQVYLASTANDELEHYVLLLVPNSNGGEGLGPRLYQRIGIGIIWGISKHADGSESDTQPFNGICKSDMILI